MTMPKTWDTNEVLRPWWDMKFHPRRPKRRESLSGFVVALLVMNCVGWFLVALLVLGLAQRTEAYNANVEQLRRSVTAMVQLVGSGPARIGFGAGRQPAPSSPGRDGP